MSNQTILGRRVFRCSASALMVVASVMAGCGQKGPLYMPPATATAPTAPAPASQAPADKTKQPADAATPAAR